MYIYIYIHIYIYTYIYIYHTYLHADTHVYTHILYVCVGRAQSIGTQTPLQPKTGVCVSSG